MIRYHALPDIDAALAWLRDSWEARETPARLHERAYEGEGPFYTAAFARYLSDHPGAAGSEKATRSCGHHRLARNGNEWDCPDCAGRGTYQTELDVYRNPCWRATMLLRKANRRAYDVVLTLVINGFDMAGTRAVLGCTDDTILTAIRALFGRYKVAPQGRVTWIDKSESQQSAEMALG